MIANKKKYSYSYSKGYLFKIMLKERRELGKIWCATSWVVQAKIVKEPEI